MNPNAIMASVAAGALALGLAACGSPRQESFPAGSTMDRLQKAGKITVGVKYDQLGVGFKNLATGKLEGFDISMAEIVAADLGLSPDQIDYLEVPSQDRQLFLQSGRVDIIIASYTINPERRRQVGQAGPYFVTGQQLLVRKEDQDTITGPDRLSGVAVCSARGSTSYKRMQDEYKVSPVAETYYTQCVQKLLNGSVDAVTTDGAILSFYAAQQPDRLAVVGRPFSEERWGIGYKKGDHPLCQFLTDTIRKAEDNGAWAKAFKDTLGKAGMNTPDRPTPDRCQD